VISEIRAISLGMNYFCPSVRTILDIGGQDTKVIALNSSGAMSKFEMNDKCAAGTGRFMEVMAVALSFDMDQFISEASSTSEIQIISSMCTVFAESEIISLAARGIPKSALSLGIHHAVAQRAIGMLSKIPLVYDLGFCGGAAFNRCLCDLLCKHFQRKFIIPENPQITAAVGCALHQIKTS
jgi:(R)-2-hydroxyacyl-CoA dehydratese activating ATPase